MGFWLEINTVGAFGNSFVKSFEGAENVPKKGPYIIAANHSSYIDHLILSYNWAKRFDTHIHYLAKKEHFDSFFQGMWHRHVQAIPIDRQAGGKKALDEAVKALNKGKVIGIYPEGTRTLDGKIQKGRTGVARLALRARVPVIPVGIRGAFKVLPKGNYLPRSGKIYVKIGKPINLEKYHGRYNDSKVLRTVTDRIMNRIAGLAGQKYKY